MVISEKTCWRSDSSNWTLTARRVRSIILIMCAHKGRCEEGRFWRKSRAASTRLSQSAPFALCSLSSLGPAWGSFGGRKTCSMTERKISESGSPIMGIDMSIENENCRCGRQSSARNAKDEVAAARYRPAKRGIGMLTNAEPTSPTSP